MPQWPRLEDPWSEKDVAEAEMFNSLHIDAPIPLVCLSLKRSPHGELIHRYMFQTGVYHSRNFLTWSRLVEALDLAYFDEDMVTLPSTADAWKPLLAIMQLWFVLPSLAAIEI